MWFGATRVHDTKGVKKKYFGDSTHAFDGYVYDGVGGHKQKARRRFGMYGVLRSAVNLSGAEDKHGCYN